MTSIKDALEQIKRTALDAKPEAVPAALAHIVRLCIDADRALTTPAPGRDASSNRIWFDTEFIEDGTTIDLISIGMVRSDGKTYYAETDQWVPGKASQWVKDNVLVHLKGGDAIKPRDVIAREIVEFAGERPEFWAYYADYDWVALCQLYGTMMQLPDGWPKFCRDIKQRCVDLGNPQLPKQTSTEHHALADALWNKEAWEFLSALPAAPVVDEAGIRADEREKVRFYRNALLWAFDRLSVTGGMNANEQRRTMREIGNVLTGKTSPAATYQPNEWDDSAQAIRAGGGER